MCKVGCIFFWVRIRRFIGEFLFLFVFRLKIGREVSFINIYDLGWYWCCFFGYTLVVYCGYWVLGRIRRGSGDFIIYVLIYIFGF